VLKHRIEAVMHFAAFAYVGVSVREPATIHNIVGALLWTRCSRPILADRLSRTAPTASRPRFRSARTIRSPNQWVRSPSYTERAGTIPCAGPGYAGAVLIASGRDGTIGEDHDPETHLIPFVAGALGLLQSVDIFGTDYPTPDGTAFATIFTRRLRPTSWRINKLTSGSQLKLNLAPKGQLCKRWLIRAAR
jgi:UDP-glucose 4-epimerase